MIKELRWRVQGCAADNNIPVQSRAQLMRSSCLTAPAPSCQSPSDSPVAHTHNLTSKSPLCVNSRGLWLQEACCFHNLYRGDEARIIGDKQPRTHLCVIPPMTYTKMRRVLEAGMASSQPAALLGAVAAFLAHPMDCLLLTEPAFWPYGVVGAAAFAPAPIWNAFSHTCGQAVTPAHEPEDVLHLHLSCLPV